MAGLVPATSINLLPRCKLIGMRGPSPRMTVRAALRLEFHDLLLRLAQPVDAEPHHVAGL